MTRPSRFAAALALLLTSGCAWHAGLAVPEGARTICIEFAENETRLPDFEIDFTNALHRATLDRVDLDVVGRASADLVMEARLVDLRRRGGIRSAEAELLEGGVTVAVAVDLVDGRTGEVVAHSERGLAAGFVVGPGRSPATAVDEPEARTRVLHNLADGVVLDLFAPLSYNRGPSEPPDGP
ncbi:MAG: LPS assembly lipoprotein LptE [Planctomycetota bacterium]